MANNEHLARLQTGIKQWNHWRTTDPQIIPDLSSIAMELMGADLREANLQGVNLAKTNLRRTNLSNANLSGANLVRADLNEAELWLATLSKADLSSANLTGAHLLQADLREATLVGADLFRTNLLRANLHRVDLSDADLRQSNLGHADLSETILTGANLSEAQLVHTNLSHATLTNCRVYGISAWNVGLVGATQTNLRISPDLEAEITVDDLEIAQFIYLMLHNEKIRKVIDSITSKVVLILGRFTDERLQVLEALRDALRHHPKGYLPVLFNFTGPEDQTPLETVELLARMARFVIADLTEPSSVPIELGRIVPDANVPVQALLLGGAKTFSLARDLWIDTRTERFMLPLWRYNSLDDLLGSLTERIITPAEARIKEFQRQRIKRAEELADLL